jgi:sugar phosphate isomerase/epimerase
MLSIGSNISEMRVDGSLKALRRDLTAFLGFGLTAAEISVHGLDLVRNGRLDQERAQDVAAILRNYPFCYSAHAPNPLNLMEQHNPELHRAVLTASLEFCALSGIDLLVYHPGRYLAEEEFAVSTRIDLPPDEKERLLAREAELLQEAADGFPEVTIAMENARPYLLHSPYCYAEIPEELLARVKAVNRGNVRITLDFGHLHMAARHYGFDAAGSVRLLAPYIAHCHVHDNFGAAVYYHEKLQTHLVPFGRGDAHMPVGWGDIPFHTLLGGMMDTFDGMMICELRGRYFDRTGEAAQALAGILRDIGTAAQIAELSVT